MDRRLTHNGNQRIRRARKKKIIRRIIRKTMLFTLGLITVMLGYSLIEPLNNNEIILKESDTLEYKEAGLDSDYLNYIGKLRLIIDDKEDLNTIINNIDKYPEDILDLLINNPETLEFALGYLTYDNDSESIITLSKPNDGEIPLYQQWDKRWGYEEYGDNIIAINGCGPTCLSMVSVGLLKNTSLNPKYISDFSIKNGYYDEEGGTLWELMSAGASKLGLDCAELGLDKQVIINQLQKGHPIIASMKPGDFTTTGHYIVLTDINEYEEVSVNDPNSIEKSNKTWELESIMGQIKNLWAFSISE